MSLCLCPQESANVAEMMLYAFTMRLKDSSQSSNAPCLRLFLITDVRRLPPPRLFMAQWHFFGEHTRAEESNLTEALIRGGVPRELCEDRHDVAKLVFITGVTPQLFSTVAEMSEGGRSRVLLVHVGNAALTSDCIWRLLHFGASDLLEWNSSGVIAEINIRLQRWRRIDEIVASPIVASNLIGVSAPWVSSIRRAAEIAAFTSSAVLITGETGTGKELVARLIHALDQRPNKREIVVVDCASLVRDLSVSEFFGHERGAFTGAITARDGAFALADGGTLFLDEVGELPPTIQAELLRAIQERTYKRVGSNSWKESSFRLVCATNRNLLQEVEEGRFRADLYHRMAASVCHLPSLHERVEDILPLAHHFMREVLPHAATVEFSAEVEQYLLTRAYPGNARDLRQLVLRILSRHAGGASITPGDIPPEDRPRVNDLSGTEWADEGFRDTIRRAIASGCGLREVRKEIEEIAIRIAVENEQGNLQRAADKLKVTDRMLQLRRAAVRKAPSTETAKIA